jgi:hypothetical protein
VCQAPTTSIDLTMKVSALAIVTVKGIAGHRHRSANVSINLDKMLLRRHRAGRTFNILEYRCGLVFNTDAETADFSAAGRSTQTRRTSSCSMVNVEDPAAIGFSMNYYDGSFDNIRCERRAGSR